MQPVLVLIFVFIEALLPGLSIYKSENRSISGQYMYVGPQATGSITQLKVTTDPRTGVSGLSPAHT